MTEATVNIGLVKEDEEEFYNVDTVNDNLDKIDEEFGRKVDKVAGKQLSSNDYTDEEKEKLSNIDENANNYTHPTTAGSKHIPSGGSSGQVLKYGGSSGTALWGDLDIDSLPISGGTLTGNIKIPSSGGNWIIGATIENASIGISNKNSPTGYHPIIAGKTKSDHVWNLGTLMDRVGFYGFNAGRTENAVDWLFEIYVETGEVASNKSITAPEFKGLATKASQDGNGKNIVDTYAKKSIYADDRINVGSFSTTGQFALACGYHSSAPNFCSASVGNENFSTADNAFAEGYNTQAKKFASHSGNGLTVANGEYSSAWGYDNDADNFASFVTGKYNKAMTAGGSGSAQVGDVFIIGNGTANGARSNALRVTYAGNVMGTKAFQSSGADYAEFIKPWADGNPDDEDRVGYFVTVKDGLLYKADEGDYIVGIISGNPSVVGNADEDYYWRYERDEFNRIVMEDAPEMVQKTETKLITQTSAIG